mmetsp:Transcript_16921/g.53144  ORF Transcript_16921/g.53144 Transcript_16921/m.53144 type:complete len:228 (-) Transcript_16921:44-727(-)
MKAETQWMIHAATNLQAYALCNGCGGQARMLWRMVLTLAVRTSGRESGSRDHSICLWTRLMVVDLSSLASSSSFLQQSAKQKGLTACSPLHSGGKTASSSGSSCGGSGSTGFDGAAWGLRSRRSLTGSGLRPVQPKPALLPRMQKLLPFASISLQALDSVRTQASSRASKLLCWWSSLRRRPICARSEGSICEASGSSFLGLTAFPGACGLTGAVGGPGFLSPCALS